MACVYTITAAEALAATQDGKTLISGSDTVLQVWDLDNKKCIADVWDQHKGKVSAVRLCASVPALCIRYLTSTPMLSMQIVTLALAGQYLFSGSSDHAINVRAAAVRFVSAWVSG